MEKPNSDSAYLNSFDSGNTIIKFLQSFEMQITTKETEYSIRTFINKKTIKKHTSFNLLCNCRQLAIGVF